MKVCAGIILYNPDIKRLKECVDAVLPQVERLVLVDNASGNFDDVQKELNNDEFVWIKNNENLGIAAALNQLTDFAKTNEYKWVLTLDQDSICSDDLVRKLYNAAEAAEDGKTAMVAPFIIDRGIPEAENRKNRQVQETEDIKFCITSGCLTNTDAVTDIGGFNEWLFVYDVDREICIRLLREKYRLIRVNNAKLYHEHGLKTVTRRFLWKKFTYRNYAPVSVYYMTRNLIYMLGKYGNEYTPSPFKRKVRMYIAFFVKFIFEQNRNERVKAFKKGVKEGKAANISKG